MSSIAVKVEDQEYVNVAPVGDLVGLVPNTPYNRINSFLAEYESKSTRASYIRYYKNMFMYMCNKSLEQLTYNDIKLITKQRVKDYRIEIKKTYKASTINQIIGGACKALWDEFKEDDLVPDTNPFDLKKLKQTDNNYGSLTYEEVEELLAFCTTLNHKPLTQKLYFKFLFVVTCRKHVAQTITWKQIKRELDIETKQMVWVISFTEEFADKSKDIKKAITDEFYNEILDNYNQEKETSGRLFNVSDTTYDNTLKAFCEECNIDQKKRNIVQHSIKGSSLDHIQDMLGNINTTAEAAGHSNIQTTYKNYLNKNRRYSRQPSLMLHKNYNINMLKGLGEDVLIELIENAGMGTITKLVMELEKIKG